MQSNKSNQHAIVHFTVPLMMLSPQQ